MTFEMIYSILHGIGSVVIYTIVIRWFLNEYRESKKKREEERFLEACKEKGYEIWSSK